MNSLLLAMILANMIGYNAEVVESTELEPASSIVTPAEDAPINPEIQGANLYTPTTEEIADMKKNANGISRLDKYLFKNAVVQNENEGIVSAFSGYSALSYVYRWTSGETYDEIKSGVGNINASALSKAKKYLPIETGTLFMIDDTLKLNTDKTSGFKRVDLQSEKIVNKVNTYVSNKTHNMITDIINKPFEAETKAVVLDTIYFKGSWENKFNKEATCPETFYGKDGEVTTDFMHNTDNYSYIKSNAYDAIRMPYRNSSIVMDVAVVNDYSSKKDLLSAYKLLATTTDNDWDYDEVILSMPKFESEYFGKINNAYESVGIKKLFTAGASEDLTKLADDLYVSNIMQKAKIIVDEEGTEAAAVTMMTMDAACAPGFGKEPVRIDVNKPFVYIIKDTKTDTILFSGYKSTF